MTFQAPINKSRGSLISTTTGLHIDQVKALKRISKKLGVSKQSLIRKAVDDLIMKDKLIEKRTKVNGKK